MYDLNDFCNIIFRLRRERGWTQAELACRLGISPQSVSKWECGIGFPDVTLFPVIAETLFVPIGILFGENLRTEERTDMENKERENKERENSEITDAGFGRTEEFEVCGRIHVKCGNVCRVEFIEESGEKGYVYAAGDPVFLRYFSLEQTGGTDGSGELTIAIKNPAGSAFHWTSYDRQGFEGENYVRVFTGSPHTDVCVTNYLDLHVVSGTNPQGNYEAAFCTDID